jgi:methionine sulfoxide reductase heme-binding subunit
MGSPLWFATRATGVVALLLLTLTVILGVAGTARFAAPGLPRAVLAGLHRNLSLLVLGFVAAHVLTTVLDSYAHIGLTAAIIPFSSPYRTLWLGLGTVAADLLLAVAVTSLLRDRLAYPVWRAVHWLAYACWPVALWHGLGTGTDSRLSWLLALDALCAAGVAAAVCWRLSLAGPGPGRSAAMAATLLAPLATAAFVLVGPLQPGWARRAGTPAALLAPAAAARPAGAGPAAVSAPGQGTVAFSGRARRSAAPDGSGVIITVSSRTSGSPRRRLTIVLRGWAAGTGIALSSGEVRITAAGRQPAEQGPVTVLSGHRITATLSAPGGTRRTAGITLIITGASASGQLTLRAADQ